MKPATPPKPDPLRQFGFKLHESQFAALADEAAHRTKNSGLVVSVGQIVRDAVTGHLARLSRRRSEAAAP